MPHVTKIYGPPGTGKTTWMLNRLDDELKTVRLDRIAYVTFSVAAREEAKNRAQSRLAASKEQFRYFRTIHGICYSEAHLNAYNVMQFEDFLDFGKKAGVKFSEDYTDEYDIDGQPIGYGTSHGSRVLNIRQVASARGIDPLSDECRLLDWPHDIGEREIRHVLAEYESHKSASTKFDFVDMLHIYRDIGEPLPIDVMFVDEAQDLSRLQWDLVHKMCTNAQRMYIAGDDDQSIYGFLGADPAGFYHHACDQKVLLRKSYRLRKNIWETAERIIKRVKEREDKPVEVRADGGEVQGWNRPVEEVLARVGWDQDTMVISQTNHHLASLAKDMERAGVPVTFKGKSITGSEQASRVYHYHRAREGAPIPIKVAISILRMIKGDHKALSERAREHPDALVERAEMEKRGCDFAQAWTVYLSEGNRHKAINDKLRKIGLQSGMDSLIAKPRVELTTYHASKGREAHTAILVTDCSPAAFEYAVRDPDNERRIAYVGITRAKERLIKIAPQSSEYMRALL